MIISVAIDSRIKQAMNLIEENVGEGINSKQLCAYGACPFVFIGHKISQA